MTQPFQGLLHHEPESQAQVFEPDPKLFLSQITISEKLVDLRETIGYSDIKTGIVKNLGGRGLMGRARVARKQKSNTIIALK